LEGPTLTGTLLIPIPTRCAHKICLHSPEKRSYRAESVEGITSTRKRARERERERERGAEGTARETNGEKQRWDRKRASDRGGARAKVAGWTQKKKARGEEEEEEEEEEEKEEEEEEEEEKEEEEEERKR